ncbi:hypothetical protein ES288_A10G129700v1 [Gossypium darwinii]|uniref:Uncharacterized protein n=1 Tax=Gossypium darwinii TaxID=34276 RepID=A0A5D2EY53_GOSDA|nr:hypothetical protein ES288_A10G129700v1 [Gossypium darwinii]
MIAKNQKDCITLFIRSGFNGEETPIYTKSLQFRRAMSQWGRRWLFWCNGAESRAPCMLRAHMEEVRHIQGKQKGK